MIKEVVPTRVEEGIHLHYVTHLCNDKLQKMFLLASLFLPFSLLFCTNSKACGIIYYCDFALVSEPVPVAARSKAWVCGRSPDEIVGSDPTEAMAHWGLSRQKQTNNKCFNPLKPELNPSAISWLY